MKTTQQTTINYLKKKKKNQFEYKNISSKNILKNAKLKVTRNQENNNNNQRQQTNKQKKKQKKTRTQTNKQTINHKNNDQTNNKKKIVFYIITYIINLKLYLHQTHIFIPSLFEIGDTYNPH
jgi:hypothetical protein